MADIKPPPWHIDPDPLLALDQPGRCRDGRDRAGAAAAGHRLAGAALPDESPVELSQLLPELVAGARLVFIGDRLTADEMDVHAVPAGAFLQRGADFKHELA